MYRVTSISPLGAIVTTDHHWYEYAAFEIVARRQAQHTEIAVEKVADVVADMSETACQHGARNKTQHRATVGAGVGNPMGGG